MTTGRVKRRCHRGPSDKYLAMLKMHAFERRAGGWRFGTKRIGDVAVERLIETGRAVRTGDRLTLAVQS